MPIEDNIAAPYPYNEYHKGRVFFHKKTGRYYVYLKPLNKNNGPKPTSTSLARYKYSIHIKRKLKKTEHIDHKDENKINDDLDNLQILTPKENNRKHIKSKGKETKYVDKICHICECRFKLLKRYFKSKSSKGQTVFCCSKTCAGKNKKITQKGIKRKTTKEIPHGTKNGYSHWKCRCILCKEAHNRYCREYRRRKREK
jgi:hypothetical protein